VSGAMTYWRACLGATGLIRVVVAAATAILMCTVPLSARSDYADIFGALDPCAAPTDNVDGTMNALEGRGWVEVPDRFDLDPDVLDALTWTKVVRWGIPNSPEYFKAMIRKGIRGGIPGLFEYQEQAMTDEAGKGDSSVLANRVLVRRGDGEIDVLLMSYRSPLENMRQVVCLAGLGKSAAEVIVDWVEAQEGPLAASEKPQFSYQGTVSPRGGITGGSTKHFAINPYALPDVPAEFERLISGVVEIEVYYQVQEN